MAKKKEKKAEKGKETKKKKKDKKKDKDLEKAESTRCLILESEWTVDQIQEVIERYTKEAGVRNLEREVASTCRKIARKLVKADLPRDERLDQLVPRPGCRSLGRLGGYGGCFAHVLDLLSRSTRRSSSIVRVPTHNIAILSSSTIRPTLSITAAVDTVAGFNSG